MILSSKTHLLSLVSLALLALTIQTIEAKYSCASWNAVEMLTLVNTERNKVGLTSLGFHDSLNHAASYHSWDQALHKQMTHSDWRGRGLGDRISASGLEGWTSVGENVAFGYQSTEICMKKWMASPGHRANILNARFNHFGAAVWIGDDDLPYFTQEFSGDGKRYTFPIRPQGLPSSTPTCQTVSQTPRSGPQERGGQATQPQVSPAAATPRGGGGGGGYSVAPPSSKPQPSYASSQPASSSDLASHCKNRPANAPPNATLKVTVAKKGNVTTYHCKWNWMVKA
ncbi:MAG: CAP domain-containing protein [Piptocephalis tieghemiana]|nr:MAG: CAP domain-containing protein [Piptocephalis tieghemiana]